jgi:hypothetical protein
MTVAIRRRKCRELAEYADNVQREYSYPLQWIDHRDIRNWIRSERFIAGEFDPLSGHR